RFAQPLVAPLRFARLPLVQLWVAQQPRPAARRRVARPPPPERLRPECMPPEGLYPDCSPERGPPPLLSPQRPRAARPRPRGPPARGPGAPATGVPSGARSTPPPSAATSRLPLAALLCSASRELLASASPATWV